MDYKIKLKLFILNLDSENSVDNLAIKLPIWLISISLLVIICFALLNGKGLEFCPPAICGKVDPNENEDQLNVLKEKDKKISELNERMTKLAELSDKEVERSQIKIRELEDKYLKLSQATGNVREQNNPVNQSSQKPAAAPKQPEVINDSYLLPIRQFHQEARCYGSSLNFTVGEEKPECVSKEELASRFLGFLVQLNQYDKAMPKSKDLAKKELIKLQQKYKFSKLGWYSIHVFNILATEIRTKALATQQN
jgi:hypothetical protein